MVKQVKGGYLLRYKKRLFGKAWREEWVVLYEDSTLAWFKEKGRLEPEGSLVVKEAPEMMAVSQWTLRIPGRPDLPSGCHVVQLMAFGTRRRDKVHWLLAQSEEEVNDWMTAISNTLPPPPQPPKPPDDKAPPRPLNPASPRLPPVPYYPSMPGEVPPSYTNTNNHMQSSSGAFPQNGYARPPIQPLQPPSNNTTIVVRDHHGCGAGDFTTGVVMGAALSNWGHGWGWGLGGYGFGHGGGFYHNDTDIHINNHYDVNNTVINNEITANTTATNNELTYVHDDYGDLGFDDGDYGMDCGGDFGF